MKKLFTSTLLTVAAVPFLMAAPNAAKKAQNTDTSDFEHQHEEGSQKESQEERHQHLEHGKQYDQYEHLASEVSEFHPSRTGSESIGS